MANGSKKIIVALFGLVAMFGLIKTQAADNNLLEALGGWASSWTSSVTTTWATSTTVKVQFPIFVVNGGNVSNYAISYVKDKSIATADLSDIRKDIFEGTKVEVANNIVTLTMENLAPSSTYNFVVTPINNEGTELDPSDEMTFTTTATDGTTMSPTGSETVLGAADTASANLTYTVSGSKVTLKWNSIAGASKFVFSSKEGNATTYKSIGEELVSKETYSFIVGSKGLYSIKIVPVDNNWATVGAEKVLSVKIDTISTLPGKGTPATGAALNMILMSTFLLMLVYVVYRFRTTN